MDKDKMIYQALLWNDAAEDPPKKVGTLIILSYRHKKLDMQKINWGAEEDFERSRDGRVEMNWDLDEANTQKLMTLMKARSGKELIYKMYRRFRKDNTSPTSPFPISSWRTISRSTIMCTIKDT